MIPPPFAWSSLPPGTQIRLSALAVLKDAATLAGSNVQDSPLDDVQEASLPQINLWCAETRDTMAAAGGIPVFKVGYTLRLQAVVIAAAREDAVQQCDVLAKQIRDALLCDPVFVGMLEPIESFSDKRDGGRGTDRYVVQATMELKTAYREKYAPNRNSVLLPGGQPQAFQRAVITPLVTIKDAIATDGAPSPVIFGTYSVVFGAGAGFSVGGPVAGTGELGRPYFGGIGFTITAGTVPWAAGDAITLVISADASPAITYGAGNSGNGALIGPVLVADGLAMTNALPQS